jgi:methylphosphotriester-DNA--protein-cysteine methyltransferase
MTTLREAAQHVAAELRADINYTSMGTPQSMRDEWMAEMAEMLEKAAEPLTLDKLSNALVMSRLIDKDAIENPEEYDDGVTLEQVRAVYRGLV